MALFDLIGGDSPMFLTADTAFGPSDTSFIERNFDKRMAIEDDMRKKMGAGMPSFKDPDIKADHGDKDYLASRYNNAKNKLMSVLAAAPIVQAAINSDEVKALQMEMQSALDPRNLQTAEENLKNLEAAFVKVQNKDLGTRAYVNLNNPLSLENIKSRFNPETGNFITNQEYIKSVADRAQFDKDGKLKSKDYNVIDYTGKELTEEVSKMMEAAGKTDWKQKGPLFHTNRQGNLVLNEAMDNNGAAAINFLMNESRSGSSNINQLKAAVNILEKNLSDAAKADLISDWQSKVIGSKDFFNALKNNDREWIAKSYAEHVANRISGHLPVFAETSSSLERSIDSFGQTAGYGSGSNASGEDYIFNVFAGLVPADYGTGNEPATIELKDGTKIYRKETFKQMRIADADGNVKTVAMPVGRISNPNMSMALKNKNDEVAKYNKEGQDGSLLSKNTDVFITQDNVVMNPNEIPGAKIISYNGYMERPKVINGKTIVKNIMTPSDIGKWWDVTIRIPPDQMKNFKGISIDKRGKPKVTNYDEVWVGEEYMMDGNENMVINPVKDTNDNIIGYDVNVVMNARDIEESGLIQSEGSQGVKQASTLSGERARQLKQNAQYNRYKQQNAKNYQIN